MSTIALVNLQNRYVFNSHLQAYFLNQINILRPINLLLTEKIITFMDRFEPRTFLQKSSNLNSAKDQ